MLQKRTVDISFAQGLDLKTDPKRVPIGKFLSLQNSIFTKAGLLQKRNGFPSLTTLPVTNTEFLTTFNDDLTAIGTNIYAFDIPNDTWINKATLFPCELSVLPLIRSNTNQSQADSVVSANGLVLTAYTDQSLTSLTTHIFKYVVADSTTGQNIIEPTQLLTADPTFGTPRVFLFGGYFVILFTTLVGSAYHLQYLAISSTNPNVTIGPTDITAAYIPASSLGFDGFVAGGRFYVAYMSAIGTNEMNVSMILNLSAGVFSTASFQLDGQATPFTVTADSFTPQSPIIYISAAVFSTGNVWTTILDQNLNAIAPPFITGFLDVFPNLASIAYDGVYTYWAELPGFYPDGVTPDNLIVEVKFSISPFFRSVFLSGATSIVASDVVGLAPGMFLIDNTTAGNIPINTSILSIVGNTLHLSAPVAGNSAASPGDKILAFTVIENSSVFQRGAGLASKAFLYNNVGYFLIAYQSLYQPTYFLVDQNDDIIAKLAYSNGGGYLTTGTPNISLYGNVVSIAYLIKDSITAVNKTTAQGATNDIAGLYTQTGINLANFTLGTSSVSSSEAANTLNLSGGFVWSYDGYVAVEQNFFLWPDYVTAVWSAGPISATGNLVAGSNLVVGLSNTLGVAVGMTITDTTHPTFIPAGTVVTAVLTNTTLTMSNSATTTSNGDTFSIHGNIAAQSNGLNTNAYFYQVIYVWTDNQGNINTSAPSIPVAVTTSGSGVTGSILLTIDTLRLTYKTANPVKIEIYRWSIANPIYYQVTSIQLPLLNNTTVDTMTFTDVLSDASIIGNEIIYTTGGVVEDIGPPATSIMTLFQTRLWLVDAEDPNLLWFSKQIIENTPIEFSDLFTFYVSPTIGAQGSTGNITAIAPMDDKLIIFKRSNTGTAIYYISGAGPDNTGANSQFSEPIFVTSTIGCNNQQSIVFIPTGLIFQSDKGLWLLGRDLSTSYIGAPVETLTENALVETAINIPGTTQVRFMMNTGIVLMYDYFFNAWSSFTLSGISSTLFQGAHTYVNDVGQVFQEAPDTYLDGTTPVLMSFTTAWISLAGLQGFERFYQCYLLGEYETPFTLNVQFAYDYNPSVTQSQIVTPQAFQPNWGGDSVFGGGQFWGGVSQVFSERVFPDQQKCETFSLQVNEIYDASFGVPAGEGLTLSGLTLVIGLKRGYRTQSAGKSS